MNEEIMRISRKFKPKQFKSKTNQNVVGIANQNTAFYTPISIEIEQHCSKWIKTLDHVTSLATS
jgi:hypothetical protein